ncbi:Hypothetical_protein [Hexamita inflata]|uniref:Hypothetical_protein n=1 Tax=Hexamita inflata TaxID=28002 RepID=A0AA86P623_9EUKA|nr:Hypothetical protein HINF_LOCUS19016 [Hexamita inflata]
MHEFVYSFLVTILLGYWIIHTKRKAIIGKFATHTQLKSILHQLILTNQNILIMQQQINRFFYNFNSSVELIQLELVSFDVDYAKNMLGFPALQFDIQSAIRFNYKVKFPGFELTVYCYARDIQFQVRFNSNKRIFDIMNLNLNYAIKLQLQTKRKEPWIFTEHHLITKLVKLYLTIIMRQSFCKRYPTTIITEFTQNIKAETAAEKEITDVEPSQSVFDQVTRSGLLIEPSNDAATKKGKFKEPRETKKSFSSKAKQQQLLKEIAQSKLITSRIIE